MNVFDLLSNEARKSLIIFREHYIYQADSFTH